MSFRANSAYKHIPIRWHFAKENGWPILEDPVGLRDGSEDYVTFIHITYLVLLSVLKGTLLPHQRMHHGVALPIDGAKLLPPRRSTIWSLAISCSARAQQVHRGECTDHQNGPVLFGSYLIHSLHFTHFMTFVPFCGLGAI